MITYKRVEDNNMVFSGNNNAIRKVEGVIVASEGAGDVITKNNIINAVATVFNIPGSNVMVFEKCDTNKNGFLNQD